MKLGQVIEKLLELQEKFDEETSVDIGYGVMGGAGAESKYHNVDKGDLFGITIESGKIVFFEKEYVNWFDEEMFEKDLQIKEVPPADYLSWFIENFKVGDKVVFSYDAGNDKYREINGVIQEIRFTGVIRIDDLSFLMENIESITKFNWKEHQNEITI